MFTLIIITNIILAGLLVCVIIMSNLLFRYVKIFNDIHENTENLKKNLQDLNYPITKREQAELLKAFD